MKTYVAYVLKAQIISCDENSYISYMSVFGQKSEEILECRQEPTLFFMPDNLKERSGLWDGG